MPPNGNVVRVFLDDDPRNPDSVLSVSGHFTPSDGQNPVGRSATADDVYIVLQRGKKFLATHLGGQSATDWTAQFPEADPPFQAGQEVLVFGVATGSFAESPFAWGNSLTIE